MLYFKTDLLIWRETDGKTFPPLIVLALGGSKELIINSREVVKMVYSARLAGDLADDYLVVVNLIALIAIVLEETEGGKEKLATTIASEIRSAGVLENSRLRTELSLLRPSWLPAMVASSLLNITASLTPIQVAGSLEGQEGAEVEVLLQHAVGNHLKDELGGLDLLLASLSVHSSSTIRFLALPLVKTTLPKFTESVENTD